MPNRLSLGSATGALLLIALAACTTTPTGTSGARVASANQVCTSEKVMGSHMPVRVCRTPEQVEAERQAARDALDRVRSAPSVSTEQR